MSDLPLPDPHPALKTKLCELVGVRYPIVQTGMGWVAGPRLVSATAEAGALGILASATMTVEELREAVYEVKSRTDAPFGVNLRTDSADVAERISLIVEAGVKVASFAQAPRPVTYSRDIAPLIEQNCAACHRPGEAAPFSLLTYEDVRKHARQIVAVTKSRYMPPWLPQPGYEIGRAHV